jgi:hypothetical protein
MTAKKFGPGLPDGIFSNQIYQLGSTLEGLAMKEIFIYYNIYLILCPFALFYCHWVYFMAIRYILLLLGTFFPSLVCCTKKNLATLVLGNKKRINQ